MKEKITEVAKATSEAISSKAAAISTTAVDIGHSTLAAGKNAGQAVGKVIGTTAVLIGDLNGDGKVDIEDARIAVEKAKQAAASVADDSAKLGKEVMQSELVKDVAPYAAIGAAIGAAAGAVLGLYKNATKKLLNCTNSNDRKGWVADLQIEQVDFPTQCPFLELPH